jgi:hypothetical protein
MPNVYSAAAKMSKVLNVVALMRRVFQFVEGKGKSEQGHSRTGGNPQDLENTGCPPTRA